MSAFDPTETFNPSRFRADFGLHTLALSPIRDALSEGFSYFVTSIAAPVASGWSVCRVGLAPTGKRRLVTAHTQVGHRGLTAPVNLLIRRLWSQRAKRWRNAAWKEYPTARLRTEFKLVGLVSLIPSLQAARARS